MTMPGDIFPGSLVRQAQLVPRICALLIVHRLCSFFGLALKIAVDIGDVSHDRVNVGLSFVVAKALIDQVLDRIWPLVSWPPGICWVKIRTSLL